MRKRISSLFLGIVIGALIFGSAVAYAYESQIYVSFLPLKYYFNGEQKFPSGDQVGFVYNGSTYVPLRFIAESLGQSVNWDGNTSSIFINSHTNEESVIFDSLTGPLSENCDIGKSGEWAVDKVNGAYPSNNNINQKLVLKNTKIPSLNNKNYTMEVEIAFREGLHWDAAEGGFLINASEEYPKKNTVRINPESGVWTDWEKKIAGYNCDYNKYYKLKAIVKSTDVDIYIDDEYITSTEIKNKGDMIGLFASYPNGKENFKNFKLTVNK